MNQNELDGTPLLDKALGCLIGGQIGDAMGTPTEGKDYRDIVASWGWVDSFQGTGTDDTIMRDLLAEALVRTEGDARLDDWAQVWLDRWDAIFGPKEGKFYISVKHTAHKLRRYSLPRMAALGNMPSSSSAMCIAPVGIVNACNAAQASLQAYNLAALIHTHEVAFCQDGAAAIAAAVAEAFRPDANMTSILRASTSAIAPISGADMLERIQAALVVAERAGSFLAFREAIYAESERFFQRITCDSRETIPLALAVLFLANGDVGNAVRYAANLGRDADTIGAMAGAIAGALAGAASIDAEWRKQVEAGSPGLADLARDLCNCALLKAQRAAAAAVELAGVGAAA